MPLFPRLHDRLVNRFILGFPFRRPWLFLGVLIAIGATVAAIIYFT